MTWGSRGIQWKTHNRTNLPCVAALCLWPGFTNRKSDIFYPALLPKCWTGLDWFWINIDSYQAKYTQVGFSYCKCDGFYTTRTTWKAEAICRVTRGRNPRETRRFRLHISLSPWRGFYLVLDPSNGAYPCPGSRHVFRTEYTWKKWQTNMFFFFLRNTDLEPVNNEGHVHTAPFRMDFCCCFRRRWAPFQSG